MQSTEPNRLQPTPHQPAEQIDLLFLDLHCALDRKRIGRAASGGTPCEQSVPLIQRALHAETLCQQEQIRNLQLRDALRNIVGACEADPRPAPDVLRIACLARAALAQAQHMAD